MLEVNKDKLTFLGSMNYSLQAFRQGDTITIHNYMPRKNRECEIECNEEDARHRIEETIERMKIAINKFQDFLDNKVNSVYYWELDNED